MVQPNDFFSKLIIFWHIYFFFLYMMLSISFYFLSLNIFTLTYFISLTAFTTLLFFTLDCFTFSSKSIPSMMTSTFFVLLTSNYPSLTNVLLSSSFFTLIS